MARFQCRLALNPNPEPFTLDFTCLAVLTLRPEPVLSLLDSVLPMEQVLLDLSRAGILRARVGTHR